MRAIEGVNLPLEWAGPLSSSALDLQCLEAGRAWTILGERMSMNMKNTLVSKWQRWSLKMARTAHPTTQPLITASTGLPGDTFLGQS